MHSELLQLRAQILNVVTTHGPISAADVAERTGSWNSTTGIVLAGLVCDGTVQTLESERIDARGERSRKTRLVLYWVP